MRNRTNKWTVRTIFHFVDFAVAAAWLEYRQDAKSAGLLKKDVMDYLDFKLSIATTLVLENADNDMKVETESENTNPENKRRSVQPLPDKRVRRQGNHLVKFMKSKQKSRSKCRFPGCHKLTFAKCSTCDIYLCCSVERNCFLSFHHIKKRIFVDEKSKKGKAKTLEKKNNTIDHEEKEYDYFCLCCLEPCSNNKSIEEWVTSIKKRIFVDGKSKKGKAKTLEIRNNTIDHEEKEYDYFCLCCLEPFSNNKSIEEWKRIFVDEKSKKGKAKTLEKKNNTIDHEEKEYDYFCLCCLEPCSNNKSIEEWKRIFVDEKSKKGKAKTLEKKNNTIDHEEKEYDYFCLCCLEPFSNNKSIEEWKRIFVDEKSKKGKAKTLEKKNNTIDHEEKEYDYFCLCCLEPCSNNKSIEEWKRIFVDEKSKKGKAKTLEKKNNTIDHEEKEYDYFCLCCLEPFSNNKSIEEWNLLPEENEQAEDIPQPDSDEWDSSDDELLARLVPASSKRWIRKSQFQPFQNLDAIAYDYICEKDPFEYFQKYISQQFFEKVAMFTNMKEVSTTGHSLDTSTTEVRQLFGCSMLIGIYGLPRMRMYWAENTRVPLIADHITRNRFFKLRSRLKVVGCG
nr:unnamed protein product [Callosobruchus chinensis]